MSYNDDRLSSEVLASREQVRSARQEALDARQREQEALTEIAVLRERLNRPAPKPKARDCSSIIEHYKGKLREAQKEAAAHRQKAAQLNQELQAAKRELSYHELKREYRQLRNDYDELVKRLNEGDS